MGDHRVAPQGPTVGRTVGQVGPRRQVRRTFDGFDRDGKKDKCRQQQPAPDAEQELEHFLDSSNKVRHHLAEVKRREEREAQKKRRENMMLLMIAMEQRLSTTSVNYCRDLLENSKSM